MPHNTDWDAPVHSSVFLFVGKNEVIYLPDDTFGQSGTMATIRNNTVTLIGRSFRPPTCGLTSSFLWRVLFFLRMFKEKASTQKSARLLLEGASYVRSQQ